MYLEGALQTRKWTDKDGQEKYSTEVVLQGLMLILIMLDGGKSGGDNGSEAYSGGYNAWRRQVHPNQVLN